MLRRAEEEPTWLFDPELVRRNPPCNRRASLRRAEPPSRRPPTTKRRPSARTDILFPPKFMWLVQYAHINAAAYDVCPEGVCHGVMIPRWQCRATRFDSSRLGAPSRGVPKAALRPRRHSRRGSYCVQLGPPSRRAGGRPSCADTRSAGSASRVRSAGLPRPCRPRLRSDLGPTTDDPDAASHPQGGEVDHRGPTITAIILSATTTYAKLRIPGGRRRAFCECACVRSGAETNTVHPCRHWVCVWGCRVGRSPAHGVRGRLQFGKAPQTNRRRSPRPRPHHYSVRRPTRRRPVR